jgi:carbon-monoxide dehydrogenase medium subunit
MGRLAVADLDAVPSDLHGSAAYRTRVGAVTVARAWTAAVEEARGG